MFGETWTLGYLFLDVFVVYRGSVRLDWPRVDASHLLLHPKCGAHLTLDLEQLPVLSKLCLKPHVWEYDWSAGTREFKRIVKRHALRLHQKRNHTGS
jgi:hypothetical protein